MQFGQARLSGVRSVLPAVAGGSSDCRFAIADCRSVSSVKQSLASKTRLCYGAQSDDAYTKITD